MADTASKALQDVLRHPSLLDCAASIRLWMSSKSIDNPAKEEILALISPELNAKELRERFYRDLEFGTGGMRGIRGSGTNRMNTYVVRKAATGLAQALQDMAPPSNRDTPLVVIAYDSRIGSKLFAEEAATTLVASGLRVAIFRTLQATPVLSFVVRQLNAQAGICVTASHNPPAYGGFKIYGEDGGQVIPPLDHLILSRVKALQTWDELPQLSLADAWASGRLEYVPQSAIDEYFASLHKLQMEPNGERHLSIVYTPLHGTGFIPALRALNAWGFEQVAVVPEEALPNGHFPTVKKPNPEEPAALALALQMARERKSDVVFATDPDADRFALAVFAPNHAKETFASQASGDFVLLNGNQTGALFLEYMLSSMTRSGRLKSEHQVIKTIVTSELLDCICKQYGVPVHNTLTGFKWIAGLIRSWEESRAPLTYLFGLEESYGYMPGSDVRDKDGIASLCLAAEFCNALQRERKNACDALLDLFQRHGAWCEDLVSVDLEGEAGARHIAHVMSVMREGFLPQIAGVSVTRKLDFLNGTEQTKDSQMPCSIRVPPSNVLQFFLDDGTKISMRPSGTEPKLKIYLSVCVQGDLSPSERFALAQRQCVQVRLNLMKEIEKLSP